MQSIRFKMTNCRMVMKKLEILEVSVRKIMALTVKKETVTPTGKGG